MPTGPRGQNKHRENHTLCCFLMVGHVLLGPKSAASSASGNEASKVHLLIPSRAGVYWKEGFLTIAQRVDLLYWFLSEDVCIDDDDDDYDDDDDDSDDNKNSNGNKNIMMML